MSKCKYCGGEHLHRDCKEGEQGSGGSAQNSNAYALSPDSQDHGSQPIRPSGIDRRPNGDDPNGCQAVTPVTATSDAATDAAHDAVRSASPIDAGSVPTACALLPDVRLPPPQIPEAAFFASLPFATCSDNASNGTVLDRTLPYKPSTAAAADTEQAALQTSSSGTTAAPSTSHKPAPAAKQCVPHGTAAHSAPLPSEPPAKAIPALALPYFGKWQRTRNDRKRGATCRARLARLLRDKQPGSALSVDDLLRQALVAQVDATAGGGALFVANVDSGCSGSCTDKKENLINLRPCSETYASASGETAKATLIGDMPVRAADKHGKATHFVIRNVRWVPDFSYTLLSVAQLWAEQGIDARFADVNALLLPKSAGGIAIPFSPKRKLPTIAFTSDAPRPLAPAAAPPPSTTAAPTLAAFQGLACACGDAACGEPDSLAGLACAQCGDGEGDEPSGDAPESLSALSALTAVTVTTLKRT